MRRLLVFILLINTIIYAQTPVFPEAYGAAANMPFETPTVLHVTSLADTDRDNLGTLRWALQNTVNKPLNRIIVFDVSGVIQLNSRLYCSNNPGDEGGYTGKIYIAGQTAPQGGITITGSDIVLSGPDTVVRYVKFRHDGNAQANTLAVGRGDYHITDHCSFSHHSPSSSTSAISARETSVSADWTKGTFSNNLMAQNTLGFIAGSTDAPSDVGMYMTVIRNAYYNISHRVPLKGSTKMQGDVVNNIVHNWDSRTIRMDGYQYNLNHFENYYQAGGNTTNTLKWSSYLSSSGAPQIFTKNNFLENDPRGTYSVPVGYDTDESVAWTEFQNNFVPLPSSYFTNTQHPIQGRAFTIYANAQLKDSILPNVGASKYLDDNGYPQFYRDTYDTEFVNGIINNSSSTRNTTLELPIVTLSNTRPGTFDTDNDGMSDAWEVREFGDLTQTATTDFDSDGIINVFEYLHQVDVEAPIVNIPQITRTDANPTTIEQGGTYTPPTGTWTDVEDGSGTATVSGDTVDVNTIGTYNVLLEHSDTDGNKGSLTIVYSVVAAGGGNSGNAISNRGAVRNKKKLLIHN